MRPLNDDTKTNDVEIVGGIESADFSVNVDGRLFDMLVADMYSNKVPSVLREIVSNALDAHAMAGTTRAVEVRLPTAFDPTFSVRDFGAGMTHEFVMKLYTKIGHSEKTGTNVATGMFGMGSKSPFAITDVFDVMVFQGGKRRQYTAYRGETRVPALRLMGTFPTDEPDGVCVRVPVKDGDVHTFEEALNANAFAYYDKNITFSRKLSGEDEEMMESIKRAIVEVVPGMFQLIASGSESRGRSHHGGVYVRQGSAIYPFNPSTLDYNIRNNPSAKVIELLQKGDSAVLFDVPVGTCSVVQSREALSYDERTKKNLGEIYVKSCEAAADKFSAVIGDARTYRQAFNSVLATYDVTTHCYLSTWQAARDVVKFGQTRIRRNHQAWLETNGLKPDEHILSENVTVNKTALGPCTMYSVSASAGYSGGISGTPTKTDAFTTSWPCIAFVIPHGTKDWERRVLAWIGTKGPFKLKQYEGSLDTLVVRCRATEVQLVANKLAEYDRFVTIMSDAEELPVLPEEQSIVDHKPKAKRYAKNAVFVWTNGEWSTEKKEVDFAEPAYYVTRNGARHDNVSMTTTERTLFNSAKHWTDVVDPLSTEYGMPVFREKGLEVVGCISNSATVDFIKQATTLKLIDDSLPIYRLTEAQALRLDTMPEHELAPLYKTALAAFVSLKDEYKEAALVNAYEVEGSYNGGQSFCIEVLAEITRGKPVEATRGALVRNLLADDTYLLGVAMHAMKSTGGRILLGSASDRLDRGRVLLAFVRQWFSNTAPEDGVRGAKHVAEIGEAAKERFPLLSSARFSGDALMHCSLYVAAVAQVVAAPYALTALPSIEPLAHRLRALVNPSVTKQAKAA